MARPWRRGRAALLYRDNGRKLVLALKHGDRHDIVRLAAGWMANAVRPILPEQALFVPVPLHWSRMLRRRFNQSALLAQAVAGRLGHDCCADLLVRKRRTRVLDGLARDARFAAVESAIRMNSGRRHQVGQRPVIIVDDVMTSGATLSECAQACFAGGARDVSILVLARVAKDT